jgi:TATA-box binding protein (TBP) (component of TFIID and TFIIIB)
MVKLTINNIKCRFKVELPINYRNKIKSLSDFVSIRQTGNIVILRTETAVYIVFSACFVNVTGIKSIDQIQTAIEEFLYLFELKDQNIPFIIDNISAHTKIDQTNYDYNITDYANRLTIHYNGLILRNNLKFPSISVRLSQGTIVLFRSGKINCVGIKTISDICYFEDVLKNMQTSKTCTCNRCT